VSSTTSASGRSGAEALDTPVVWRVSPDGARAALRRAGIVWPVLVVALVLAAFVASDLSIYKGDPAGFVVFGRQQAAHTHPPAGAPVQSAAGYDGQLYWLQANDPLLLDRSTIDGLSAGWPGYHLQRPAYPALAYVLATGQRSAIPWTMLAINVFSVLAITAAFAVYARRRGWSPAWACVVGLMPGLLLPTLRDLSDVLATACMFGGLLLWTRERRWGTAGLLAVAALAREPMALAVVAVAADAAGRCWHARRRPADVRRVLAHAWPAVVVPAVAFIGWQLYTHTLHAPAAAAAAHPLLPPFRDFVFELQRAAHLRAPLASAWEIAYLSLTAAAVVASLLLALSRRGSPAPRIAAALFALTLGVVVLGDQWGLTRYAAPMFLVLLLIGLEQRSRVVLGLCVAGSAMTLLAPMTIGLL
jgi:hypothetical protein